MKIIGLTGGIGSGKTTVARLLEARGYSVYYSDNRAKEIVNDNNELKAQIINLLGENAYDDKGNYNRRWVADKVFKDNDLLQKLNAIIHPAVKQDFENWVLANREKKFLFKETALLFELNLDKNSDASLLVTADENIRIKRVMDRDGKTFDEVKSIIKKQMPEEEKRKKTDFIIENNADETLLQIQVEQVIKEMLEVLD